MVGFNNRISLDINYSKTKNGKKKKTLSHKLTLKYFFFPYQS